MTSDNDHDYTPISCATHSELELEIMHRQQLQVEWHESGDTADSLRSAIISPLDLLTRAGEEFLICRLDQIKTKLRIRLDRITKFKTL